MALLEKAYLQNTKCIIKKKKLHEAMLYAVKNLHFTLWSR